MRKQLFILGVAAVGATTALHAQTRDKGTLTGSLESNSIYYVDDSELGSAAANPDDHFGSNNYLKLDYVRGKFSAGVQLEGFFPALQGYDYGTYGNGRRAILGSKYVAWEDGDFGFRVGDIFDQYGSGLVFRSYEDRTLGFNNSIEGVWGHYSYKNYVSLKGMYGRPRLYLDYAESAVRGADLTLSLSDMVGWKNGSVQLEGSYVNRYENLKDNADYVDRLTTNNLDMYAVGGNLNWNGLDVRAEYVTKTKDLPEVSSATEVDGNAILAEVGYATGNFSAWVLSVVWNT